MRFIASGLEDIATMMDKMAANERKWSENARTATAKRECEISARVWEQAAGIVRDTVVQPTESKA